MPDLTPTQKATLRFLRHRGPCRISTVAFHFHLGHRAARKRAEELVALGLVEKVAIHRRHVVYQIKETP